MSYKIIALVGKAGTGKDTLLQNVLYENPDINEIISHTTRPKREKEVDGIHYHFVSGEKFGQMVLDDRMIEATSFNDWFYGTSYDSLRSDCINIGVFNPDGVYALMENPNIELTIFYVATDDKERLMRQLSREKSPNVKEIIRRYHTDEIDFASLDFEYDELTNNTMHDLRINTKLVGIKIAQMMGKK